MAEIDIQTVRELLSGHEGQTVTLDWVRSELQVVKGTRSWERVREMMPELRGKKLVKPTGRQGEFKIIRQVERVNVYESQRKPPIELFFPRDFETGQELPFFRDIVFYEGDLVLITGFTNKGKTGLIMNWVAELIEFNPVLMGNEFTDVDMKAKPRFLDRLDKMDWVEWSNGNGEDKFELYPVQEDFAEHVVKDRINFIDWIDNSGDYSKASQILRDAKLAIGKGILVAVLQMNPGVGHAMGGYQTQHYVDCEIQLDNFGDMKDEILLTVGKVKQATKPVMGKTYNFYLQNGVKIMNFHEVVKCRGCGGTGKTGKNRETDCDRCYGVGWQGK